MGVRKGFTLIAGVTALAVLTAACGDDDDTKAEAAELEQFCDLAKEIDQQDDFPSTEQLESYRDLAPTEIREAANTVVDAFLAAGDDPFAAFEAPGVDEAFEEEIEPFETEQCGIEHGGDEEEPEQDASVTELDPAAQRIDVIATEYAFELAAPAAGRTSFVMKNEGKERHVMVLFRLDGTLTMQEVLESEDSEGIAEEYESDTAAPGEEAVLTADLVPGEWGMICYIATADGPPHFMSGMTETFTIQ